MKIILDEAVQKQIEVLGPDMEGIAGLAIEMLQEALEKMAKAVKKQADAKVEEDEAKELASNAMATLRLEDVKSSVGSISRYHHTSTKFDKEGFFSDVVGIIGAEKLGELKGKNTSSKTAENWTVKFEPISSKKSRKEKMSGKTE